MYPVSAAYRAAMKLPVQRFALSGTVGETAFQQGDLLDFSLQNQCSDGTSLRIGQVYVGELHATFTADFSNLPTLGRYGWSGKSITPTLARDVAGLNAAAPVWESVPLGVYTIPADGVTYTREGVEVVAYDNLAKLDKLPAITRRGGATAFQIARRYAEQAHVELGQTQEEFEALPNGREKLYLTVTDTGRTGRDVFAWLGEVLGCFATAGRDGKIYFRPYSVDVVDTLDPAHRWQGCSFSGYVTRYSQVTVTNTAEEQVYFAFIGDDDYLSYDLGENPLLQAESEAVTTARLYNILYALSRVNYVPFSAVAIGDPAYDLGDVLRFPGGIGDGSRLFCITQFSWTLNGEYRMSCAGENPELRTAKSAGEKSAESAAADRDLKENRSLFARNVAAVSIGDGQSREVLAVTFATAAGSHVEARAEILLDVETTETGDATNGYTCTDAVATVTYELDGVAVTDRHPVQAYQDGRQVLSLQYDFSVGRGYAHEFRVLLALSGGAVAVAAGNALISLSGIGVGEEPEDYPEEPEGIAFLRIDTLPAKTTYLPEEVLDYTGLSVLAVSYDGTETDVTALCTLSPADGTAAPSTPGPLLVSVEYASGEKSLSASFTLDVAEIRRIDVTQLPVKTAYYVGETLDMTGLVVTAFLSNDTERDITAECTTVPPDGYEVLTAGFIIVEVQYHGEPAAQFELTAEERGIIASGDWWTLFDDGELVIFYDGDMPSFKEPPWYSYKQLVTSAVIGNSVTSIGSGLFYLHQSLTSVTIPQSVTSIKAGAFNSCGKLANITIPDNVTSIGNTAFASTSLTSITIPSGVTTIEENLFHNCIYLTNVMLDGNITKIERMAFYNCDSLTSIMIPASVTSIGAEAFASCNSLTSIMIPASVTSIGAEAFGYCHNLEEIAVDPENTAFTGLDGTLFSADGLTLIQYPSGNKRESYAIPHGTTSIGDYSFKQCDNLTSVSIPSGVTSIGKYAFYSCHGLTSVAIPASVSSIGDYAFIYCRSLSDVFYDGTSSQWRRITIGSNNTSLTSATIHYNSTGP